MPQPRHHVHAVLAAIAAAAIPAAAAADPVVLAVDGERIYVELGGRDGVGAGTELELLHVVVARDPSTGATLRDEFALGTLTVDRAGDHVALATAPDELVGRVAAGDRVRLIGAPRAFRDPWLTRIEAAAGADPGGAGGADPDPDGGPAHVPPPPTTARAAADADAVRATWQATLGAPLDDRAARWRGFLDAHPGTAYAAAIRAEIASLERQDAARADAIARAAQPGDGRAQRIAALAAALGPGDGGTTLAIEAPARVVPGDPIDLAFLIRRPAEVGAAVLYARTAGAAGYTQIAITRDGDAYLRARIPAAVVAPPRVEWFVEVTAPNGDPAAGVGSRTAPRVIAVDARAAEPAVGDRRKPGGGGDPMGSAHGAGAVSPRGIDRSRITLALDYVDFDGGLDDGFDQYAQAELEFTYRFIRPIYAFRIGFGTLSGTGGPKDVIDEDPTDRCLDATNVYRCRRVAFNYVYAELEHRFRPTIAVMLRPTAGLVATDRMAGSSATRCTDSEDIADCDFTTGVGLRARVRLGDERSTNLVLGAGFTDGVGTVLEARYRWLPAPVLPVELSVEVTDQPVPEDFGVRLIADVGWRGLAWFYPSVRLSMQARDIDHTGFSGGAAMNFDF
jgi:hypothetical protein